MDFKKATKIMKIASILVAFFASIIVGAQSIDRPVLRSADLMQAPSRICASPESRIFSATAKITSGNPPAGTIFSLQLSNPTGTYGSGTVILALTTANGSDLTFDSFEIPEFDGSGGRLSSDTYKIRVIIESTNTRGTSTGDLIIHYFNGIKPKLSPVDGICQLKDAKLTAESGLDSYVWFESPRRRIANETGPTYNPTATEGYFYTLDYGSCTEFFIEIPRNSRSNTVSVFDVSNTISVAITAKSSTDICASQSVILESDQTNSSYRYQWEKDGEKLDGETGTSITVSGIEAEGSYSLRVAENTQTLSSRCTFQSNEIFVDLKNPTVKLVPPLNVVDIPGQEEVLTAQVGGTAPVITWIKNGVEIPNSNTATFNATGPGTYKVKVVDNGSPCDIKEVTSTEEFVVGTADNFSLKINYDNPSYVDCNFDQISLVVSEVFATINGEDVPVSTEGLDIVWTNNDVDTGRTGPTLFINTAGDNGKYKAVIRTSNNNFFSNELPVQLSLGTLTLAASPQQLSLGGSVELSVNLPAGSIISQYKFQWLRGVSIELPGETQPTLTVSNAGNYSVRVSFENCTETIVGPISLQTGSAVIPNVLSRNSDPFNNKWILPALIKNNPEYEVLIYTANGKLDYQSGPEGYTDQWPDESISNLNGTIYYYVINKNSATLEKGSITIIR